MTVADLGERMTAGELMDWLAYERVEGPLLVHDRIDAMGAMIGYLLAKLGGSKRARPKDFLPKWDQGPKKDPWDVFMSLVPGDAS